MFLDSYKSRFTEAVHSSFFPGATGRLYTVLVRILLVGGAFALGVYFFDATWIGLEYVMFDFVAYWHAGEAFLKGLDIYAYAAATGLTYTYPPISALFFAPFALLPFPYAQIAWYAVLWVCLIVTCAGLVELMPLIGGAAFAHQKRFESFLLMFILTIGFYPVWTSLKLGQASILVVCFMICALWALYAQKPILGGMLLGLAITIKVIPAIWVVYALWIRKYRFAFAAAGTFLGLELASLILHPQLLFQFWGNIVEDLPSIGTRNNIALYNLVRQGLPNLSPLLQTLTRVFSFVLLLTPFAFRSKAPYLQVGALSLLLAAVNIFGPLSELNHLLWLCLPVWILVCVAIQQRDLLKLSLIGGIFLLLSQPFRLARFIENATPIVLPPGQLSGGSVIMVGVCLLYFMLLFVMLRYAIQTRTIREHFVSLAQLRADLTQDMRSLRRQWTAKLKP